MKHQIKAKCRANPNESWAKKTGKGLEFFEPANAFNMQLLHNNIGLGEWVLIGNALNIIIVTVLETMQGHRNGF